MRQTVFTTFSAGASISAVSSSHLFEGRKLHFSHQVDLIN
ncbi:hypothetical protein FTUN_4031 [Frigoriglobus tundricola]|uniref:Uncharacterized protein n=1 Tax=Frigoriglobus tundricola TaxID=2774151 RepID=A0A6M5YSS1_9BACT|nr:hypothetical protein FTUN_4031 [Frigoriglobus tundricola]